MTMPVERTRSLIWMRDLLEACSFLEIQSPIRLRAEQILQNYPTKIEIEMRAELGGWLEPLDSDPWSTK